MLPTVGISCECACATAGPWLDGCGAPVLRNQDTTLDYADQYGYQQRLLYTRRCSSRPEKGSEADTKLEGLDRYGRCVHSPTAAQASEI